MPFYVYILQSESTGRYYIGHTRNLQERLLRHNEGRAGYTRAGRPWRLVYGAEHESRNAALKPGHLGLQPGAEYARVEFTAE